MFKYIAEQAKLINRNNWGVRIVDTNGRYVCTITTNKSMPQTAVTHMAQRMVSGLNRGEDYDG